MILPEKVASRRGVVPNTVVVLNIADVVVVAVVVVDAAVVVVDLKIYS